MKSSIFFRFFLRLSWYKSFCKAKSLYNCSLCIIINWGRSNINNIILFRSYFQLVSLFPPFSKHLDNLFNSLLLDNNFIFLRIVKVIFPCFFFDLCLFKFEVIVRCHDCSLLIVRTDVYRIVWNEISILHYILTNGGTVAVNYFFLDIFRF